MEAPDRFVSLRDRKLVVLGIPFDVETEELKYYMQKFGELEDCIVMKDRSTGQSRGFGYVTFSAAEDAKKVTAGQHVLNGRTLDIKVATPKDEMAQTTSKKGFRIFVARIPSHATEGMFRSHFQKYGVIVDSYMPKDVATRMHRGIGFITFENAESVDKVMSQTHELGGTTVAVDQATPKDETPKFWSGKSHPEQSNETFPEQWRNDTHWAKDIPEEWANIIPEQWAKAFPEQFNFFIAAAAAAAQMGAFNGMEGFDLSAYGLPAGTVSEKTENPCISTETEVTKAGRGQVTQSSRADDIQIDTIPSSVTVGTTAAYMHDSELAQNNAPPAYAHSAPNNPKDNVYYAQSGYVNYSMPNSNVPYGCNTYVPSRPPVYVSNTPQSDAMHGDAYGCEMVYSTSPRSYNVSNGYYAGDVPTPTSVNQSYEAEYPPRASYSGSYGRKLWTSHDDSRYVSSCPYVASHMPFPSDNEYSRQASYIAYDQHESYVGYGQHELGYGGRETRHKDLPVSSLGNKLFIGRLPREATIEDLQSYFSSFGRILDVYIPKDAKKTGHRGFGFVTFFEDGVAEQVAKLSHEILGQPVAVDQPTPQDCRGFSSVNNRIAGPTLERDVNRMGYCDNYATRQGSRSGGHLSVYDEPDRSRPSRFDARYRPY